MAAALALRLASNWWLTLPVPLIDADALWYHASATRIAAGLGYTHHFTQQPTAAWPPGYPAILALIYRIGGADPSWGFLLNAIAGAATCWLAGRIAAAVASPRAELPAMLLVALLPSHVLFASLLLSETVYTALMTVLVLAAIRLLGRSEVKPPPAPWLAWGFAAGLASLIRAEAVVLLAAPVLAIACSGRRRLGAAALVLALAAAGSLVAQLPWLVRNARLFGRVVPVSTSFGRTFLIGHNPIAGGDMNLWSPDAAADARDLLRGGPALELAVDDRLRDAAYAWVRENPGREIALIGKRLWSMYRGDRVWGEWYRPSDPARVPAPAIDALGKLSSVFYWTVMLLALPGLLHFLRRPGCDGSVADRASPEQRLLLPAVIFLWTAFFVVVLYGSARFHFPLMPLLCVLAADTAMRLPWLSRG